jgi:hypothetical protein
MEANFMRAVLMAVVCLLAVNSLAGAAGVPKRLLIMEAEIDGDLSPRAPDDWAPRLALLRKSVGEQLASKHLYEIADPAAAEASFAKHRSRFAVHACVPCILESASQAGADRALSLVVHRVSNLVLSMQAIIRDTKTGDVVFARAYDFRGDTDQAWLHAAGKLVGRLEQIPAEMR